MNCNYTFAEALESAQERLGREYFSSEMERVHEDAVRDQTHAFRNVEIRRPDPWHHDMFSKRTDMTI